MTTQKKVESLIEAISALPEEAQTELVQSLIEHRSMGRYHLDDEERTALAQSGEDERLGRFASVEEIESMFAEYGA